MDSAAEEVRLAERYETALLDLEVLPIVEQVVVEQVVVHLGDSPNYLGVVEREVVEREVVDPILRVGYVIVEQVDLMVVPAGNPEWEEWDYIRLEDFEGFAAEILD